MRTVIESYNPGGIDDTVLGGTGRGGLFADGYLREDPLESYVDDAEVPVFVRSNARNGVVRERIGGGESDHIRPANGYRAFLLATDTRLYFVIGDNRDGSNGDCAINILLSDIQLVDANDGLLTSELIVTTAADVRWRFPTTESVADVSSYLEVATAAWKRLENHLDDARERLLAVSGHREAHEYQAAMDALASASEEVAAARRREEEFVPAGVAAMDSRIERTAERVRRARLETFRARAAHRLDRAEQLWREDAYGRAHERFREAHADYVAALDVAEADFDAAAALRTSLARVECNLASLERAPVEQADQARERASETEDPDDRAALLERALERYRRALELDWGSDHKRFAGDTAEIRERVDAVAADLVETRRRLAATRVREGDRHRDAARTDRAADCYREAGDLLDAALATARELVPDVTDAVVEHREAVERRLDELDADGSDRDADDSASGPTGESVVSPT